MRWTSKDSVAWLIFFLFGREEETGDWDGKGVPKGLAYGHGKRDDRLFRIAGPEVSNTILISLEKYFNFCNLSATRRPKKKAAPQE